MCLAIPGRVLSVEGSSATLDIRGTHVLADASMVDVRPGDYVVVYAGLIVQTLDPADAEERLGVLGAAQPAGSS